MTSRSLLQDESVNLLNQPVEGYCNLYVFTPAAVVAVSEAYMGQAVHDPDPK